MLPRNPKLKIADDVLKNTLQICGDIKDKKILDVGCRTGENAYVFARAGADVYGVDFDVQALEFAVKQGYLSEKNIFKCRLEELPADVKGTFDIATVWLFCIDLDERDAFFKSLAEVIKTNGQVIIGVADEQFAYGQASIRPWLEKYFDHISMKEVSGWNQFIFQALGPKLEHDLNHETISKSGFKV